MLRLVLTPSLGGEFALWEKPTERGQYIVSCDPSLGRVTSEKSDTSCIGVWLRMPGSRLRQVAEVVFRWSGGRVGEVCAAMARRAGGYLDPKNAKERNCAIINIERNLCDVPLAYILEQQAFPDEYLFIPRQDRDLLLEQGVKRFFTPKTQANQDYLLNNLVDYLDRDALEIRSKETLDELRTLSKDRNGRVDTNGKDRAVMVLMACAADRELGPVDYTDMAWEEQKEKKKPEYGRVPADVPPPKKSRVPHRVGWQPWNGQG